MEKKVMFITPALETDAVYDPIRTCSYLGIWYLASLLKEKGHEVRYLDEVVRDGGLAKHVLFKRTITGSTIFEEPLSISFDEFNINKMHDFENMSVDDFNLKYSVFKDDGSITRFIVRTGNSIEETLSEISEFMPDVIGIPLIASANYLSTTRLGKRIKEVFPSIKIILGGQHASAEHETLLRTESWIDQLITGDAICVIEDIVNGKISDRLIHGGFQDFDKFPLLDPSIISETQYPTEPNYAFSSSGRKTTGFMFSKGCFRHCEFCVTGNQKGGHVSAIDYASIDKQMALFKKHGYKELVVQDDAFLNDYQKHLPEILRIMKKYGFFWQNNGGIDFEMLDDFVTEQFLRYNKVGEGRITSLYIPFNPRAWNKGGSAADTMTHKYARNFENLKRLRNEAGIFVFTTEIVGTPEHTMETMLHDIDLHKSIITDGYLDAVYTLVASMLPGTKWHQQNHDTIINKCDYTGYSLFVPHHRTANIPDPRTFERIMILRAKEFNRIQKSYKWGNAFPNVV